MANNERIRKYLDAGSVFGQVTRGRAEEIVRELVSAGDIQRSQAQEWVDTLVERSRKTSEQIIEMVRHEVATQLSRVDGKAIENLSKQVADVLKKSADAGRKATKGATDRAEQTAKKARKEAGKTVTAARNRATQTAGRARAAAEKAVPTRKATQKPKPAASKKSTGATKSAAAKKATTSTTAKKSAAKKAH